MRRFFIPEAIQTSAMDCGPAALKSLLEGFNISASYGRLREACQTDVDGTSIDTIEETAVALGLEATQTMLPLDHVFEPAADALPAIIVVRQPNGATHFVVAWRRHGSWIQVMDPAVGRRWLHTRHLLNEVYEHSMAVEASAWREFAESDAFLRVLRSRCTNIGVPSDALIEAALANPGVEAIARLDASVRMTTRLVISGAVRRGQESSRMVATLAKGSTPIPKEYWSAKPIAENSEEVLIRGAVLIQVKGRIAGKHPESLPPDLAAALAERPSHPALELFRELRKDGLMQPMLITCALFIAAFGSVIEALVLRGLYDLARELTSSGQRAGAIGAAVALLCILTLLEFVIAVSVMRVGRRVDVRLRLRFLHKIPRLADRYFRSRPSSDMAERSHNVHQLRQLPLLASTLVRNVFEIALTVAAIGWLYPSALWPSIFVALAALCIPLMAQPLLAERDLKLRSHAGALMRFNLDALLGVTAIRAHGAARAVRREQSALLSEWARSGLGLQRTVTIVQGLQISVSLALAAWVVWTGLSRTTDAAGALLLVYWVLNLPALGEEAASVLWQYPMFRNTALRYVEPLGAPEEPVSDRRGVGNETAAVGIYINDVTVLAGGHRILENVTLDIAAGTHVGIVGRSGAGKSSLVGLLLGWHRPSSGAITIDGRELDASVLDGLRASTAWVDPQVQIWNRSLFENLTYGNTVSSALDDVLEMASLETVLSRLPQGMQTRLGEGGGLVSGGEGQRVRMGRAMARDQVRLAILDEPARGLDRHQRRAMVERARERWRDSTLLCITHDVSDTLEFDRVLVIEDGHVVEDGIPAELAIDPSSRYSQLIAAETLVHRGLWASSQWRRFHITRGQVRESPKRGVYAGP